MAPMVQSWQPFWCKLLVRRIEKDADVSKMKIGDALPNRSFYPLGEAATLAGCTTLDIVHYAVQDRIALLTGVPDWGTVRIFDETANALQDPFLLTPQLLGLSPAQCLKIEMQGRTRQSDFKFGYSLESDGDLKRLLPSYGRHELNHAWVFWRVFQSGEVCLLDLGLDQLFVTRTDLIALMGHGEAMPVAQSPLRKEKTSSPAFAAGAVAQDAVTVGVKNAQTDDVVSVNCNDRVDAANSKSAVVDVRKAVGSVEVATKPSQKGPVILRLKQVMARTGLSRSTIYDRMAPSSPRHDPGFPKQVNLGGDAVGWEESAIDAWLQNRIAANRN